MLSLNWRTVKKYSDPAYEPSPPKRQRPHLIDRFMPQLRECVRNRYTLQETDAHLRQLGYRGSFGAVRHRSRDARREGLPEPQVFISRKDVCRLLWQWPVTRPDDIIMSRSCWSVTKTSPSRSVSFKGFGKRFESGTRNIFFR